jgi:uncharacterized RDD family membrane protein YckC
MSAAPAVPARLLRRYAAWSLDMALVSGAAAVLCLARVHAGAARIAASFDALVQAMSRSMLDALMHGGSPLDLTRQWLSDPQARALVTDLSAAMTATALPPVLMACVLSLVWFAGWEASPHQATPGKRLLGLRAVDLGGRRMGPARAAARHLAGSLSWLTLNIGHLLAAAPPQYQALHDRIAGTRVLHERPGPALPPWAQLWIAAQVAGLLLAAGWLFMATQAAMQRALDAALL